MQIVSEQAEDEGLWTTNLDGTLPITEALLQHELRRLHAALEGLTQEQAVERLRIRRESFELKDRKRTAGRSVAWMRVSPQLLAGVDLGLGDRGLNLPPDTEIIDARMWDDLGAQWVEFLIQHESIPQEAHRIDAEYSHKPLFDRFTQSDPIIPESPKADPED